MTEAANTPRIFSEAEFRHMLSLEVQRCTRYQDFLSLCLIRAGSPDAAVDLGAAIRRQVADMLRSTDFVGSIGSDTAVMLVHTPETDAGLIVDRIRDRVRQLLPGPPRKAGRPPASSPVDLRLGSACFPVDGTSDEALLTLATARLEE